MEKEFYPTDALDFESLEVDDYTTKIKAIKHSLRKWEGLRKSALAAHDGYRGGGAQILFSRADDEPEWPHSKRIFIDGSTCALCILVKDDCDICPISIANNDVPCTGDKVSHRIGEYGSFIYHNDPEPMIKLLEKTLKFHKNLGKEKQDESK